MRTVAFCLVVVSALAWAWFSQALAQVPDPAAAAPPPAAAPSAQAAADDQTTGPSQHSFWEILKASGIVGLVIILLSIAAVALIIEHAITIRGPVLMPPGMAEEVRELILAGRIAQVDQRCRTEPSVLAHVLGASLAELGGGWPEIEKAAEDTIAEQSARLFRKVEYLNVIGNIAPMLGLLGTVIGMVMAFREVAVTQGAARAADLAHGIYLALVTTVEGLVVAIPAIATFAFFRSRVDQLMAEVTYKAQHALTPLKRQLTASAAQKPPTAQAPLPPPVKGGH